MSSTIGAAGLALAALLEAAAADSTNPLYGVQVTFGPPDRFLGQEVVALLGVSSLDEVARVLGPQPNVRDENYGLDVTVRCYKPEESDAKVVWTRGWAMYDAVRNITLTTPDATKLGGLVQWALPTGRDSTGVFAPPTQDGAGFQPGWEIQCSLTFVIKARA